MIARAIAVQFIYYFWPGIDEGSTVSETSNFTRQTFVDFSFISKISRSQNILLYTNRQSSHFHAFHWWRAYLEIRLCPSHGYRGITKKSRAPSSRSREHAIFRQPKSANVL